MTFIDNVSAAVDRLGTTPVGIVLGIGVTDFPDSAARDGFLDTVVAGAPK